MDNWGWLCPSARKFDGQAKNIYRRFYGKGALSIKDRLGCKQAHLKEREHDRAFYQLCTHMEPDYFQLEFDLRLYLTQLDLEGGGGQSS